MLENKHKKTVRTEMITIKIPDQLKNVIVSVILAILIPLWNSEM